MLRGSEEECSSLGPCAGVSVPGSRCRGHGAGVMAPGSRCRGHGVGPVCPPPGCPLCEKKSAHSVKPPAGLLLHQQSSMPMCHGPGLSWHP